MPRDTGTKRTSTGKVEVDASIETAEVVDGGLKIGESADATERTITWDNATKKYKYHDGTDWVFFGGASTGGGAYEAFAADPTDTFTHVFAGIESLANYTAFASDTTEVFGFDTEAQP